MFNKCIKCNEAVFPLITKLDIVIKGTEQYEGFSLYTPFCYSIRDLNKISEIVFS